MTASSRFLVHGSDTIAALATPPGISATALIRMSGPAAFEILGRASRAQPGRARVATLRPIFQSEDATHPVDRCLVTVFPAPASYTGEDLVEISSHGGHMVPSLVLASLLRCGARQALPGEFTRRALLNGKLDLLQAEAVADLIDARSRGAAAAALSQLDGGLTRRITELRVAILEVEAMVAYDVDFPEEDDGPLDRTRIVAACENVTGRLTNLLATVDVGEMLREGALVVIAGVPNAGKSSLFNALVGRRRSLVTEIPGTTRDAIEAVIDADDWTLRLVDTAGLRETSEVVEKLGIEVAEDYLVRAQMIIVCGSSAEELEIGVERAEALAEVEIPIIAAVTKSDLDPASAARVAQAFLKREKERGSTVTSALALSAISGAGLATLLEQIGSLLGHSIRENEGSPLLTRARHEQAVTVAREEMRMFVESLDNETLPMSVAATHLRAAADSLESLIGAMGIDDILDVVFRNFCVGK